MSSERADQPATPDIHHGVPGKALADQREAMGWTVEQVADQLKLAVRQVVALEAGDYASLPGTAVVRGFVRAYAKILKIDAAPLVAMIEIDNPEPVDSTMGPVRRDKPASFSETRFPSHGKRKSLPLVWIAAGVAIVAATAAAWHLGMFLVPQLLTGGTTTADSAASTSELAPPVTVTRAPAGAAPEPLLNPSVPLISVPSPATDAPVAGPAAPAAGVAAAPAAAAPVTGAAPAAAAGANPLVLSVREDSWVDVRPAKGAPLISRLVKGGSTETVQVNEPVTLVVGKPSAVSATLRGAAVALPLVPGKTVSRVTLK